jgi:Protein of unknown function (DUF3093)
VAGEATALSWQERLWPSVWLAPVVLLLGIGFGLVATPLGGVVAVPVAVLATLALGGMLLATTATVAVADGMFRAGRALIPVELLGTPEALDAEAMRHARGPGLDARAYLCLRGWVPAGVRVPVLDPRDPTPYWLVSSRRPEELAEALDRARRG